MDPSSEEKRRAVETQDFTAVILVGYGDNLYPFNQGTNVLPKALMPVGNVPIINLVLDWVFASGLTDVLIVLPPTAAAAVSEHVQLEYLSSTDEGAGPQITIKTYDDGEDDDQEEESYPGERAGTARILKRFRSHIKSDFVLLPCDISFPSKLTLASILDQHRANPDAVMTSVFYEPTESVKESEEKMLVTYDKETDELLLVQSLDELEEDLELRMSLLEAHPTLSLSTRLLDAHVYVFRRAVLDLLATRRSKDLSSVREQFVPWLLKGQWQQGLAERWTPILCKPRRDPFAEALARSTTLSWQEAASFAEPSDMQSPGSESTPLPPSTPAMTDGEQLAAFKSTLSHGGKSSRRKHERPAWSCRAIIVRPEKAPEPEQPKQQQKGKASKTTSPADEPEYIVRANSLAGYWEINRRMVKVLGGANAAAAGRGTTTPPAAATPPVGAAPEEISGSAQVSPDSLVGDGVRVGDRASIKKCVVGRHCNIGKGAKLTGCVLWDWVTVEDNARIENTILCPHVRIGEKAVVTGCELGPGFEAKPGAQLKGERLIAGQEA